MSFATAPKQSPGARDPKVDKWLFPQNARGSLHDTSQLRAVQSYLLSEYQCQIVTPPRPRSPPSIPRRTI